MTSVIDMVDGGKDPEAEVRKLQDLVKKLETQNEVLRRKQKLGNDSNIIQTSDNLKSGVNNSVFYNTRKKSERKDSTSNESLETVDLIDIEKCVSPNEKEDSWLYSSPRPPTPLQTKVSPYKWVRQDFDNPSPDVQSARKSLKYKLDEVARMSRSSSTPAFQNHAPPKTAPTTMSLSADSTPSPRITPGFRGLQGPGMGGRVNTGTFTRPKKKDKPSPTEANGDDTKENQETIHHPNVADIENLAKLQEESLRQSIAQTSPRRGFRSRPMPNISNQNDNDSSSPAGSNRSSPARYLYEEGMNRRNSNNSLGSDHSSPPDSPYGSNQHLNSSSTNSSNLRGSFPNVSRLVPRAQHHNSDSSLADYQPEENNTQTPENNKYTSRIQQSQLQRPSSPSVSGLKQPGRSLRGPSPVRTGLPTPTRRSIPRPGSAGTPRSSLPAPRRISGLPPPGSRNNGGSNQHRQDEHSWKEGCF